MHIETIDVVNNPVTITFKKLMSHYPDKLIPMWFPKNYNNQIHSQFGTLMVSYDGELKFTIKSLQSRFQLFNNVQKVYLTISTKYNEQYKLVSKDGLPIECNYKAESFTNEWVLSIPSNKECEFTIKVENPNVFYWNVTTQDEKPIEFNIQFKPDYKQILNNQKTINKKLLKSNKITDKKIKYKVKKISKLLDENKIINQKKKSSQLVLEIVQNKNKELKKQIADNKLKLKITTNEKKSLDLVAQELQSYVDHFEKANNEIEIENKMLKTNLTKYRNENNKIIKQLHAKKDQTELLQKEITHSKQKIRKLNDHNNNLKLDNKELKNFNEILISENKLMDGHIKKLEENQITSKLKITEYELKIESLQKKLNSKSNSNSKSQFNNKQIQEIFEIFNWYKCDAMPPKKTIKLNKDELQEYIQNLEDEIVHILKNKKQN